MKERETARTSGILVGLDELAKLGVGVVCSI
jgi:hypothetical protein